MLKKQQKTIKINQKNTILMSEKISVVPINTGFSWKYVKEVNPLKQGLKHIASGRSNPVTIELKKWIH